MLRSGKLVHGPRKLRVCQYRTATCGHEGTMRRGQRFHDARAVAGSFRRSTTKDMDAIELLTEQHREVERLVEAFRASVGDEDRQDAFNALADAILVHTTLEEKYLYPAAFGSGMENHLREAAEQHLAVKREVADLLATAIDDEYFDAKLAVLEQLVTHHVSEEEESIFPMVLESLGRPRLERLAEQMQRLADEIEDEGSPRDNVFSEITRAAQLHPAEHVR